ncbi:DUF2089 domain-containing protein [Acholeplasma granularum]|uniref:DUF2089 domain-containing protein n=1 Tax=Acholeplasma granularum TaxID=264635 RepID=UPI0004B59D59|nr:DUF2089 domain-containing protein [Acholeplasma granularum]
MNKLNQVITKCPICNENLHIMHLACGNCHTEIKGEFSFSKFNYINQETLYFIEIFVKNRGNIKAIEKEMNISYPTVKKYLDEAIVSLGYKVDDNLDDFDFKEKQTSSKFEEASLKNKQQEILNKIKVGELKVDEAVSLIKKIKGDIK